ncbi:hypothetical protein BH23CHL1_BH23CHL1_05680 [soil metagenome]
MAARSSQLPSLSSRTNAAPAEPVISARIRSPLRWLWAFIGSLAMLAIAGLTGIGWFALGVPVAIGLFLFAPPLGLFRHDEQVIQRAGIALSTTKIDRPLATPGSSPIAGYTLILRNDGLTNAEDFSLRLLVPDTLSPRNGPVKPLGRILRGQMGTHWFIEGAYDATALTFRTRLAPGDDFVCHAGESMQIAELHFSADRDPHGAVLDYQVSGGSAKAALGQVRLS